MVVYSAFISRNGKCQVVGVDASSILVTLWLRHMPLARLSELDGDTLPHCAQMELFRSIDGV